MTNAQEKHVSRLAQSKGYRLEKVGKGPHHGRFSLMSVAQGSRVASASRMPGSRSRCKRQRTGWRRSARRPHALVDLISRPCRR